MVAIMAGCEVAKGLRGLTISPSSVELSMDSNIVEFAVVGDTNNIMALPLEWSVDNPRMGYIVRHSGWSAWYRGTAYGESIVTARDQYDNEGSAVVRQIAGNYTLSLTATRADTNRWTIIINNRTSGPYTWWVSDPTLGNMETAGTSATAVYAAQDTSRENTIFVRDGKSQEGSVRIP
jgi:hypothetical protein